MTSAAIHRFTKAQHKAAARMVLDTLHLAPQDGLDAFWGLSVVLRAKLSPTERTRFAWAALRACDDDEATVITELILGSAPSAGWPLAPLFDVADEAAFWAERTSREELRAYLLACFRALPANDQAEFVSFAQGRVAA